MLVVVVVHVEETIMTKEKREIHPKTGNSKMEHDLS